MSLKDDFDETIREMKIGADATAAWSDVTTRIADALEHMVVNQTLAQLAMSGLIPDPKEPAPQHRVACPVCRLARTAQKAPLLKPARPLMG